VKNVTVKDVMTHLVVSFHPDDPIIEAAKRLARNRISGGPVVEDGRVVGMVSEADLIAAVMPPVKVEHGASVLEFLTMLARAKPHPKAHGVTVNEVMTPIVIQIGPEASIWEAASLMERRGVKRLPVVDEEDQLVGLISRADLVRSMARDDEDIRTDVLEAVAVLGGENFEDLQVTCTDGVVTLRGGADRRSTKEIATELASRVAGVVEVVDHLMAEYDDRKTAVPISIDHLPNWPDSAPAGEQIRH
jgi:CBS domain-containing protein